MTKWTTTNDQITSSVEGWGQSPILFDTKWSIMAVSIDISHSQVSGATPPPLPFLGLRPCLHNQGLIWPETNKPRFTKHKPHHINCSGSSEEQSQIPLTRRIIARFGILNVAGRDGRPAQMVQQTVPDLIAWRHFQGSLTTFVRTRGISTMMQQQLNHLLDKNQSLNQWLIQSINQSIIQSISESTNQSVSQSIIQSVSKSSN